MDYVYSENTTGDCGTDDPHDDCTHWIGQL